MSYFSKLKTDKKIIITKSTLRKASVWVYLAYKRICVLDINEHNKQGCIGLEPVLLFSAEELKQSALIVRARRHFLKWNNEKFINMRFNDVTIVQKIMGC